MKRMSRLFILAIFMLLTLGASVVPGWGTLIRIGVLAKRGPAVCVKKWAPMAQYLASRIPGKAFEIVPLDFDQIIPSVQKRACDFVLVNPAFYVELEYQFGADRIATLKNLRLGRAYTQFGGVVFCRADRKDIRGYDDLKGKRYAAPNPFALGSWIAVRRELNDAEIDPYHKFKSLKFLGTMDAVVYAVRDGRADAGSVRTDTLERMAQEGKINIKVFRIIGMREKTKAFPFACSTRLYPEWPFAKVRHTSRKLAEQVTVALIKMSRDSAAARAAKCAGWTIPLNYQSVHECLKELKLGPYRGFGKVTFADILKTYWSLILVIFVLFIVMVGALVVYFSFNRKLKLEIEERKREEEALRKSEERFRIVSENSHDGIFILGEDYKFKYANDKLCKIFEHKREEIIGHDFREFLSEDSKKLLTERYIMRQRGIKVPSQYEAGIIRGGGEKRIVEIKATVVRDSKNNVRTIGQLLDITERKQAEEALRESEERFRVVVENSHDGILILGEDYKFEYVNDKLCEMFGREHAEIIGHDFREFLEGNARELVTERYIKRQSGENVPARYEFDIVRGDGEKRIVEVNATVVRDSKGGIRTIGQILDITERRRAEEEKRALEVQLNQSQKMEAIGVLAGGVAHDFNNLLTAIIGNADLAQIKIGKDAPAYQNIEEILKSGQRAAALTRQLLAFSRKELIRPEVLNINNLAMNLEKMLRRLIGEDIDLVTVYAPDLWAVKVDPGQMEQVIMNLSVNARDAMPEGGKLTIETGNVELDEDYCRVHGLGNKTGEFVMLAVTDSGVGMDRETQARIFEPFFTTKGIGRGTGLGLSTVYGIVKQNKGYIWVYSEPGEGTTFKVYLPRSETDVGDLRKKQFPKNLCKGIETILVVEDDETLCNTVKAILEGYGYRIIMAPNGKEAVKMLDSHDGPVHLLLTDVVMPGMSGRDLAIQLQSRIPGIKILYMSGYTDNAIVHHGVLEKDVAFIQKPFTGEGLAGKVREILDTTHD